MLVRMSWVTALEDNVVLSLYIQSYMVTCQAMLKHSTMS